MIDIEKEFNQFQKDMWSHDTPLLFAAAVVEKLLLENKEQYESLSAQDKKDYGNAFFEDALNIHKAAGLKRLFGERYLEVLFGDNHREVTVKPDGTLHLRVTQSGA